MNHLLKYGFGLAIAFTPFSGAIANPAQRAAIEKAYANDPIEREIALGAYEVQSNASEGAKRLEAVYAKVGEGRKAFIGAILFQTYLYQGGIVPMFERSQSFLSRASQLRPDDRRPYQELRNLYCWHKKYKLCKAAHIKAVQRDEGNEVGQLRQLANTLSDMQEFKAAVTVLKQAYEAEKEKPEPSKKTLWEIKTLAEARRIDANRKAQGR